MGGDARDAPSWRAVASNRSFSPWEVIFALLADGFRARNVSCVDRCGRIYLAATSASASPPASTARHGRRQLRNARGLQAW